MTVILVESNNDDTICVETLNHFNEYSNTIFSKLTGVDFIPRLYDPKIIPNIMKIGDYFIIKKSNFDSKVFNSTIELTLYKIKEKETGWVRSVKIKKSVPVKTITGTCIDMYQHADVWSVENIFNSIGNETRKNDTTRLRKVIRSLPENWETNPIAVNFVNKMRPVNEESKYNIIEYIQERLSLCERSWNKEYKKKIAIEIYEMLITKDGMDFIYNHWRFYETCLRKLCEFYYTNEIDEVAEYFNTIYGSPISVEIANKLNAPMPKIKNE